MYVIQRSEDDKYVAPPGSVHSYTHDITKARIFSTRDKAEGDKCENERIVDVHNIIRPTR